MDLFPSGSGNDKKNNSRPEPWVPVFYILVMASFLASALIYTPRDTLLGVAMTATALQAYTWLNSRRKA